VRTTLTIDDDVAALLKKENRRANEPMKQTVNRALRSGLLQAANPPRPKRFVVKPLDLGTTPEQWAKWSNMKLEDILEEAERPVHA
jgi:hypothetical protein